MEVCYYVDYVGTLRGCFVQTHMRFDVHHSYLECPTVLLLTNFY